MSRLTVREQTEFVKQGGVVDQFWSFRLIRERPALHIPYIILEYGALFGLIHIAFTIGPTWGYAVAVGFWLLLATVIFVSWDQITGSKRRAV